MREAAAVTTPKCWSLSKWMIRDVHSPLGITSGHVRSSRSKHRAADCFTTSIVSLHDPNIISRVNLVRWKDSNLPGNQKFGDFSAKGFGHFFAANVCDTLKCQVDVDGITRGQVIFNTLDDETNQVTVRVNQDRNEQIAL